MCWSTIHGHLQSQQNSGMKIEKSWNAKETHRFIKLQGVCVYCEKQCAQRSWWKRCMYCSLHKYGYHLIKTVRSVQRLFSFSSAFFFSLNYRDRMSSMLRLNPLQWIAPTHQPQNRQNSAHTVQANPLCGTLWKRSPLFFFRSSSPSLRLGHRCRHCGSMHSWVSCV